MRILIVGAGLSGAVVARCLAEAGHDCRVIESRNHIGGNCYTRRDADTGVLLHVYGPHIFHTDDFGVWNYVNRFAEFVPFRHRVKTTYEGAVYSLPINLHTINQFFGKTMRPDEARAFINGKTRKPVTAAKNFIEQATKQIGPELTEAFFSGYTEKQWGCPAAELPASVFGRLPLRFNYDDNYFSHRFQGMPRHGYTAMIAAILWHKNIAITLNTPYHADMATDTDHIFWSGPIDAYFGFSRGRLAYRTLEFERFEFCGDYQGCPVMNYADREVPYTRITEHKHLAPWEHHDKTVCYREYSRAAAPWDIPFYPVRLANEERCVADYIRLAENTEKTTFIGRLGTYRYLDMDVTIREASDTALQFISAIKTGKSMPAFLHQNDTAQRAPVRKSA